MKKLLYLSLLTGLLQSALCQQINPEYDSTLARSLSSDEYGMKSYVLVILKTGSNKIEDRKIIDSLFAGHMQNIVHMADIGKLVVAGPMGKNDKQYRGIFILNVTSFEEAKELIQKDPAIQASLLDADLYHWYGSAALPTYLETHKKIEKYLIQ